MTSWTGLSYPAGLGVAKICLKKSSARGSILIKRHILLQCRARIEDSQVCQVQQISQSPPRMANMIPPG